MTTHSTESPIVYIPHGGGPLPLLGEPGHRELVSHLASLGSQLPAPSRVLVVSAHWEEAVPTLTGGRSPGLIYDYYGFPPESYQIEYGAPGEPAFAGRVRDVLRAASVDAVVDDGRGFDHGMFVPLKIMYPQADVACVQLSLVAGLSPGMHVALGRALSPLRRDGTLVVGSGMSFHNLRALGDVRPESRAKASAFDQWLVETCTDEALSVTEREGRLLAWEDAPSARFAHPREEHLMPLHVCFGMASATTPRATVSYRGELMGFPVSGFRWP